MAGNRKPRKPYRQKVEHRPMMATSRDSIATQLHVGISAMIAEPSLTSATLAARNLAIMAAAIDYQSPVNISQRVDAPALAIKSALLAAESVEERFHRVGKWGVNEGEAKSLRAAAGLLDSALARIPHNVWQAAEWVVDRV